MGVGLRRFEPSKTTVELYNLEEDPAETKDLSKEQPELVKEVLAIMEKEHVHNEDFPFVVTN
ncbi:hypothetical protein [Parapedobacter soli]|uniref:hypothetical protein n=1 Tax=Parapedobacter soli TaxID=416955 RepID=UPI0021C76F4E|nr:hypothetical protein [Parapedobacter soli]